MNTTDKTPIQCPECGSTQITGPDHESLWDCSGCGIWFEPGHPNNTACFGGPATAPAGITGKPLSERVQ